MCHYQIDPEWYRRRTTAGRPSDVATGDVDAVTMARRPATEAPRPVMQRVMGVMCRLGSRMRGLLGRLRSRPSAGTRLYPHMH